MQTLVFDTKIFPDGIIKIPELSNWKDSEVSIIVIMKPKKVPEKETTAKKEESNSSRTLADFNRVRQMKTAKAEVLTLDKAINIYDGLTSIS